MASIAVGLSLIASVRELAGTDRVVSTVFAHGLGGNERQGFYYTHAYGQGNFPIEGAYRVFNFPDYQDIRISCLGQEADIATLYKNVELEFDAGTDHIIIGFGVSRGASTWLNLLGDQRFHNFVAQRKHKVLLVAESPFDHVQVIATGIAKKFLLGYILPYSTLNELTKKWAYPNYDPHGA